mmetsp:Transcript_46592/g.111695  ORF Transcript_46592/g.111695 Transcript_46592/m.111695 type:complete len:254 (+) Transcript_46592:786-1547(+)
MPQLLPLLFNLAQSSAARSLTAMDLYSSTSFTRWPRKSKAACFTCRPTRSTAAACTASSPVNASATSCRHPALPGPWLWQWWMMRRRSHSRRRCGPVPARLAKPFVYADWISLREYLPAWPWQTKRCTRGTWSKKSLATSGRLSCMGTSSSARSWTAGLARSRARRATRSLRRLHGDSGSSVLASGGSSCRRAPVSMLCTICRRSLTVALTCSSWDCTIWRLRSSFTAISFRLDPWPSNRGWRAWAGMSRGMN